MTERAANDAGGLGYSTADVLETVLGLGAADFWRSERSRDRPGERMDIYKYHDGRVELFIKFARDRFGIYKLVSFHES